MGNRKDKYVDTFVNDRKLVDNFRSLSQRILGAANNCNIFTNFLSEISDILVGFSETDALELRFNKGDKFYKSKLTKEQGENKFNLEQMNTLQNKKGKQIPCSIEQSGVEEICRSLFLISEDTQFPLTTDNGSFWTGDIETSDFIKEQVSSEEEFKELSEGLSSLALIPFEIEERNNGLLILKSQKKFFFTTKEIDFYECLAQNIGLAISHQKAQSDLRERVKELTCLYGLAQLVEETKSIEDILEETLKLLPPAWQYPEHTSARITFDGKTFAAPDFDKAKSKQSANIVVDGNKRGKIEVVYTKEMPELDEGPFLKEERDLIDTLSKEIAMIIERRQGQEEKNKLQKQLRHADRLATLGQLSAGIAHELNEPLGNILGFSQLAMKSEEIPDQVGEDLEKIKEASLHAREVVKKLLLFGRQMPTEKKDIDLNEVISEGLYFLESRCEKEGIEIEQHLTDEIPAIRADKSQIRQVLVNLVVNAIQAIEGTGKITIRTFTEDGALKFVVQDNGKGMDEKVQDKIFLPFFTTKETTEGTGLGLPVVHGIISSHGGEINVESEEGEGTSFTVQFPIDNTEGENNGDEN